MAISKVHKTTSAESTNLLWRNVFTILTFKYVIKLFLVIAFTRNVNQC